MSSRKKNKKNAKEYADVFCLIGLSLGILTLFVFCFLLMASVLCFYGFCVCMLVFLHVYISCSFSLVLFFSVYFILICLF